MVLIDTFEGTENSRTYATALVNIGMQAPQGQYKLPSLTWLLVFSGLRHHSV